ncbi:phosphotransferase family protein [Aromatoleum toluclasticum]|uniref:phosphotransferase family protein n=1 Tax=Aromatoleum toluclasticum TaxID=92003 RepID=UPI00037185B5|nr:phosphotransferase family protein [Aromatoleum toluclasticum]
MDLIDKNRPSPAWIRQMRERFPCERAVDAILTRKLERRAGRPFKQPSLHELMQGVKNLLDARLGGGFELSRPRWLVGGASKIHVAFELTWDEPLAGRVTRTMVLRMEPAESTAESSRLREFQLIKACEGLVPVPKMYWLDEDGSFLPYPAVICGFNAGVTKPSRAAGEVAGGPGAGFDPAIRPILGAQFVDCLARIHTCDWLKADLGTLDVPAAGTTQAVEWQLNWWERVWEEDAHEDVPLMRLAMNWLREHMPVVEKVSLVHGDYRTGNFLYTEHDNKISAILDWELGHLGDRHEDIAYAAVQPFGSFAEDGKTFLVGGFMPREQFYADYEKASGLPVREEVVRYYEILITYKLVAIELATMYRIAACGKTHHDILMTWLIAVSYPTLALLRDRLEAAG